MRILVTGSAGHLGEGLIRRWAEDPRVEAIGLDVLDSPWTGIVASITDRAAVRAAVQDVDAVVHTATLHKPHVGSHTRQDFVDTNITGTLILLEESVGAGVSRLVFTSSTTTFGHALSPPPGAPAAWITEDVVPVPKNVYGATKTAAEDLCELVHQDTGLPVVVLRTSRFFPEGDDRDDVRSAFDDLNLKTNELLFRRVDLADAVDAHRLAVQRAPEIGFDRLIVSATTPFTPDDLEDLGREAPGVIRGLFPDVEQVYGLRGWRLPETLDRVYVNARAREALGWRPRHDFRLALDRLRAGEDPRSALSRAVGAKGYHAGSFGIYTVR